jgi:hypothetical protein
MRFTNLLLPTVMAAVGVCNATVVFSNNFDSNFGQSAIGSGAMTNTSATGLFTVTSGTVDVVGPNFFAGLCMTAPESASCVDLDGSSAGAMQSDLITLTPGNYTLAFDIDGNQRGGSASATVNFGSYFNQTYALNSSDTNAVSFTFDVTAPDAARIVFTSNDSSGDLEGALVDNVALTQNSTSGGSTPEPSSRILLVLGGAAIVAAKLRRPRA